MNWPELIKDLTDAGMTQAQIGMRCGGASQTTISELRRGVNTNPSFVLGASLQALHTKLCKRKPAKAAA